MKLVKDGETVGFDFNGDAKFLTEGKRVREHYIPTYGDLADFLYLNKALILSKIRADEYTSMLVFSKSKAVSDALEIPTSGKRLTSGITQVLPAFLEYFVSRLIQEEKIANPTAYNAASSAVFVDSGCDANNIVRALRRGGGGCVMVLKTPNGTVESDIQLSYRSPDFESDVSAVAEKYTSDMSRIQGRYNAQLEEMLSRLRSKIDKAMSSVYAEVFKDVDTFYSNGWTYLQNGTSRSSLPSLQYKNKIEVTHLSIDLGSLTGRAVDKGKIVMIEFPKKLAKKMYIKDLTVPMSDKIESAYAKGLYPHLESSGGDNFYGMCIGDSSGKSIRFLPEFVDSLKVVNFGSMYGGEAPRLVHEFVQELKEKFKSSGEIPGIVSGGKGISETSCGTLFHTGSEFSTAAPVSAIGEDLEEDEGDW